MRDANHHHQHHQRHLTLVRFITFKKCICPAYELTIMRLVQRPRILVALGPYNAIPNCASTPHQPVCRQPQSAGRRSACRCSTSMQSPSKPGGHRRRSIRPLVRLLLTTGKAAASKNIMMLENQPCTCFMEGLRTSRNDLR